jgi:hypothetical protein
MKISSIYYKNKIKNSNRNSHPYLKYKIKSKNKQMRVNKKIMEIMVDRTQYRLKINK